MMISDLPLDLESEILYRVPTKSLAKLQINCKRWYNLFKDPKFVKKNLGKSAREVMLLTNSKVHTINLHVTHDDEDRIDASSMEFRGKLGSLKKSERVNISDMFYCDGLILCTIKGNKMLVVWNPCNGQTRSIKPRTCYRSRDFYALGYGKILRYCCNYKSGRRVAEFEIYEFSSDSWRDVLDVDNHDWVISSRGVSLKGNAYWIAKDEDDELDQFILSFDFTTERFRRFPLPYQNYGPDDIRTDDHEVTAVLSVVRDEQLSVLHQNLHTFSLDVKIWVTDKIDETEEEVSWREFLVVDLSEFEMERLIDVVSFLLDEENKVAVCCSLDVDKKKKTRISIVGEDKYKQVYQGITRGYSWPLLLDYVPSLAHIQNGKRKRETKRFVK